MPYAFGAAAGGAFPQLTITQSQTWVPPQDGVVCIHVVGAGGSGAIDTAYDDAAGGAGAYAKIPSLAVTTAGSFTLVVGVGGASRTISNAETHGFAGGNSTIAGTGITGTLTCGGGGGGRTDMYSSTVMYNAAGGAVSGSANEGWAGFAGSYGFKSGGSVRIHSAGANGIAQVDPLHHGELSDVAGTGGIAMSGYGTICGGARGGQWSSNNNTNDGTRNQTVHGEDLCGGGYANSGTSLWVNAGDGGIGGGGGSVKPTSSTAQYASSGRGGHGLILIQYLS
jgi:hypothetical protein